MSRTYDESEVLFNIMAGFIITFVSVLFLIMTVSYFKTGSLIVLERHGQKYEVVGIKPPKHFQLDLRNVDTGKIYKSVDISKHCMKWKNLKLGTIVKFDEVSYKYEKKTKIEKMIDTNNNFCDSL